ncbi:MAG TPA: UDP-N-acetylmuramoyl-L-alanyl-D-glutamate--2,6-diaminopimelate ligase [Methylomirabilota bacterium]|nr:UDP-N-acetylmuramoyl-L-alanyl-D-glutamate--2,6-diaminopimelate ligase [Methylomirabilota bacterium]
MMAHRPVVPLSELVGHLSGTPPSPAAPLVRGVAYDSRTVRPGDLFVCLRGAREDGHRHAAEAVRRGAVALVVERPVEGLDGLPRIAVPDTRRELPRLAARFYGEPSARLHLTGVTGTEGKTTTVYLLDAILRRAGVRSGMFGTIVNRVGPRTEPALLTTAESVDLQRMLWECVQAGVTHVVMEVTSHALAQGRVARCEFDVAVFTNLHVDHLDFHGSVERYRIAKAALFGELGRGPAKAGRGVGVVNMDDAHAWYMRLVCPRPVVGFGMARPAPVKGRLLIADLDRTVFKAETPNGTVTVSLPLAGPFNAANALAAIAAAGTMRIDLPTTKQALEGVAGVPGRLERVPNARGLLIVIDFAHTQAAFEEILPFLRRFTAGRLITVFGCAGDRDRTKRPVIGRLVTKLSDFALVTTDNPASEDPADIAQEVAHGAREVDSKGERHLVILDRRQAVRHALALARSGDVVLVAGKGHEDFQLIAGARIPYSDRETLTEILRG